MEDHLPLSVSYSFVCVGRGPYFEEIIQRALNRGKGKKKKKKRKKKGRDVSDTCEMYHCNMYDCICNHPRFLMKRCFL